MYVRDGDRTPEARCGFKVWEGLSKRRLGRTNILCIWGWAVRLPEAHRSAQCPTCASLLRTLGRKRVYDCAQSLRKVGHLRATMCEESAVHTRNSGVRTCRNPGPPSAFRSHTRNLRYCGPLLPCHLGAYPTRCSQTFPHQIRTYLVGSSPTNRPVHKARAERPRGQRGTFRLEEEDVVVDVGLPSRGELGKCLAMGVPDRCAHLRAAQRALARSLTHTQRYHAHVGGPAKRNTWPIPKRHKRKRLPSLHRTPRRSPIAHRL